jgi:hypothetical protein
MLKFNDQELDLKYLFTVGFADGTVYEQNEQDVSVSDPTRSCFFDVLEQERNGNPVIVFCLTDGVNTYLVDLRDGHFEVNGIPFRFHEKDEPVHNRRLIFARRRSHQVNLGSDEGILSTVYRMGWQGNATPEPGSKNIQHVMEID